MALAALLAAGIGGGSSLAQDMAQGSQNKPWDLPRLVRYALANNKDLAAAKLGTDVAREDVAAAKGQRLPRVDVVSSLLYTPLNERLLIPGNGFRPTKLNPGNNPFQKTILDYGLQATMPLYTGGRIQMEVAVSKAAVATSRSRSELSRQELIFNVSSAYFTYLRVKAVIAAGEALVRSVGESRRIAEERVKIGRAARLDVLRLEARLSAAESRLTAARDDLERIAETLKALLALPPGYGLKIDGDLTPDKAHWDEKAALDTALSKRPDILALRRRVEAQRQRIGIAGARAGPTMDASVFYGAATGKDQTSDDARFMLKFRLPLYSGGVLEARKRREKARLRQLEAKLGALKRQALAEVRRAVIELSSTKARLDAGARAIDQAKEALRVERQKFREGRGTGNDLLLAEESLLQAKTGLAAALSDGRIATVALQLATGELDAPGQ